MARDGASARVGWLRFLLPLACICCAVGSCSSTGRTTSGAIYVVVGAGTRGDGAHHICLSRQGHPLVYDECYRLGPKAETAGSVGGYPPCVRAAIVGRTVESWTEVDCG